MPAEAAAEGGHERMVLLACCRKQKSREELNPSRLFYVEWGGGDLLCHVLAGAVPSSFGKSEVEVNNSEV